MSESVQFWLDNKMSAGIKVAAIGDQVLVAYREKFYVIEKDAAHTKGGKPIRYSNSSMPAIWKRALKGEILPAETLIKPADDAFPVSTDSKQEREKKKSPKPSVSTAVQSLKSEPFVANSLSDGPKTLRSVKKKADIKSMAQTTVTVACPQCNQRHELFLDKGKSGKPFFMACEKCKGDFAVRFVPVIVYQAQVAGFR
jgi:hypothetical protein